MRPRSLAFAFVFALSMPMAGHAASFDCAKARTPVEKAICADGTLGRLDEQIGDSYRQAFDRLDARFRPRLLASQRLWLKARVVSPALESALTERLDDLRNAIVTVNGLTLLRVSGKALPPYVMTALPGAAAYNRWVDQVVDEAASDAADAPEMARCDARADQGKFDDACDALNLTSRFYQVDVASPELISVHQSLSVGGWRTAHPANEDTHMNWWLARPGQITRGQIFADARYRTIIREAVKARFDFDVDSHVIDGVEHPSLDPRMWGLTPTGLSITCQGYDVAIGRGQADLEIPWADFAGVVDPTLAKVLARAAPITDRRLRLADD